MAGVKPIKEHASDREKWSARLKKKLLKESLAQRRKDAEKKAIRFNGSSRINVIFLSVVE
jgi:hypothetical protein